MKLIVQNIKRQTYIHSQPSAMKISSKYTEFETFAKKKIQTINICMNKIELSIKLTSMNRQQEFCLECLFDKVA